MITKKEEEFLVACFLGNIEKAKELIKDGVNIEARDVWGRTALMLASWQDHKDTVQMLLDVKANVDARDEWGNTALFLASWNGYKEIVELLKSKMEEKK